MAPPLTDPTMSGRPMFLPVGNFRHAGRRPRLGRRVLSICMQKAFQFFAFNSVTIRRAGNTENFMPFSVQFPRWLNCFRSG